MKKILTLMMVVLMVALSVMPVMADNYTDGDWQDGASEDATDKQGTVDGAVVEIIKYFTTSKSSEILDVEFAYEVSVPTVDDGVDEDTNVYIPALEPTYYTDEDQSNNQIPEGKNVGDLKTPGYATVYAGIEKDNVKVYWLEDPETDVTKKETTLKFSEADKPTFETKDGDFKGNDTDTKKTSKKTLAVDFSGIEFTEPGIYRYWIQESSSSALTLNDTQVTGDAKTWRTIDVYVIDPETGNHNVLVTGNNKSTTYPSYSVVYEGKLTNAPKTDIEFKPDTFDGTSSTVITGTTWTYEDATGKYEYKYVPSIPVDPEKPEPYDQKAWEETFTPVYTQAEYDQYLTDNGGTAPSWNVGDSKGVAEIQRNRTTHLNDSYGVPTGKEYAPATYNEAIAMGATEEDIKAHDWKYENDEPKESFTYHWDDNDTDSANHKWVKTGTSTGVADSPSDAAVAKDVKIDVSGNTVPTMTYATAKSEAYVAAEVTIYEWIDTSTAGTKTTYKWDTANKRWTYTTEVETNEEPSVHGGEAAPVPNAADASTGNKFVVSPVKYSYVFEQESADFSGTAGYNAALQKNPNGTEAGKKTDNYVNEYFTQKLEVSKTVTGNQGSRDKYFKYTITIKDVPEGSVIKYDDESILSFDKAKHETDPVTYPETVPNAATTYKESEMAIVKDGDKEVSGNSIKTYTVIDPDNNPDEVVEEDIVITVFLQHGQKLVLEGIPKGSQYTVKEENYGTEGYKASVEIKDEIPGTPATTTAPATPAVPLDNMTNDGDTDTSDDAEITSADGRTVTDSAIMKDAAIAYTNTKSGVIPTGVFMSITGGVALIAIAIGAIAVLNRRRAEEEE